METQVTLLHTGGLGIAETRLVNLVEFMGGAVRQLDAAKMTVRELASLSGCVIGSAAGIAELGRAHGGVEVVRQSLANPSCRVLVYGFKPGREHAALLYALTRGQLVSVEKATGGTFQVAEAREVCAQLSGLQFETSDVEPRLIFKRGQSAGDDLISCGGQPFLARAGALMLLAGDVFADLDAPVARDESLLRHLAGVAPLMMFLRHANPEGFWHNPEPLACFIVDDPLLQSRYGFLEYSKLVEVMERQPFSASIAFIPWNYRRSRSGIVEMFATRHGALSLSVHGCDHTRGEFGGSDERVLRGRSQVALERMEKHRKLTGLGYDDVMVFPQGIFSTKAMRALKECGYLAAVNSTPYPVDAPEAMALREHLGVAVLKHGFPLFTRRYPQQFAELAFDVFLGKPALLVEHHEFFRDGCTALEETVRRVSHLDPRLRWTNLGTVCLRASRQRLTPRGEMVVEVVTARFQLVNHYGQPKRFQVIRPVHATEKKLAVFVNGREANFVRTARGIELNLELNAGERAELRMEGVREPSADTDTRSGMMHQAKVMVRRHLCEFRDNHVATSRLLRKPRTSSK
ncbi:MAG: hypothetical protein RLY20_909 [Verrucomicrobiota bacterium]|jgi:hypothetical protein